MVNSAAAEYEATIADLRAELAKTNARVDKLAATVAALMAKPHAARAGPSDHPNDLARAPPTQQRRTAGSGETKLSSSSMETCRMLVKCDLTVDGTIVYQGEPLKIPGPPTLTPTPLPSPQPTPFPSFAPVVCEVLVVAGGGGNSVNQGSNREAGSGAGGLIYAASVTLLRGGGYAVVVGAGGSGHANGANSAFAAPTGECQDFPVPLSWYLLDVCRCGQF